MTDTSWTEIKATNIYSSQMVNCYNCNIFIFDWYHEIVCYDILEKGFISTQQESRNFVSLSLNHMTDINVAKYMTGIICENIGNDMYKKIIN